MGVSRGFFLVKKISKNHNLKGKGAELGRTESISETHPDPPTPAWYGHITRAQELRVLVPGMLP